MFFILLHEANPFELMETLSEYITSDIQVQYLLFDKILLSRADIVGFFSADGM